MKKKITLFGEEYDIAFNMAVQVLFERTTSKAFDLALLNTSENQMTLFWCMLCANNEEAPSLEKLLWESSIDDIKTLNEVANELITEWYHIPTQAHFDDEKKEEEDNEKNA